MKAWACEQNDAALLSDFSFSAATRAANATKCRQVQEDDQEDGEAVDEEGISWSRFAEDYHGVEERIAFRKQVNNKHQRAAVWPKSLKRSPLTCPRQCTLANCKLRLEWCSGFDNLFDSIFNALKHS